MSASETRGEAPRCVFHVITLFSEFFEGALGASLLGKAIESRLVDVELVDLREFATDRHRTVDDTPYGGGSGMVIRPDVVVDALEALPGSAGDRAHRILLSPAGKPLTQADLARWAELPRIALVCGRYEGIDDRVGTHFIDEQVSLGDFVLGGGEGPALCIIEGVTRLVPGVVGNRESVEQDSFAEGLLEHPQYTRPRSFRGHEVPEILLSGDHGKIARWRHEQAVERTRERRPDLLARGLERADR